MPAFTDHAPLFQPSQKGEISLEDAAKAGMPSAAPVVAAGTPAAAAAAVVAQAQAPGAGLPGPPPAPQVATSYLMVVGMVTAEVLADDEEYEEVADPPRPLPCPATRRPQRWATGLGHALRKFGRGEASNRSGPHDFIFVFPCDCCEARSFSRPAASTVSRGLHLVTGRIAGHQQYTIHLLSHSHVMLDAALALSRAHQACNVLELPVACFRRACSEFCSIQH